MNLRRIYVIEHRPVWPGGGQIVRDATRCVHATHAKVIRALVERYQLESKTI
jgi:hypothetical protein